jgi:hypothetical protein
MAFFGPLLKKKQELGPSPIIQTHKNPIQTRNYFPAGFQQHKLLNLMGM